MQKRGLGARKNIHGPYRLCLTDQTLSLVKIGAQDNSDSIEISVSLYEMRLKQYSYYRLALIAYIIIYFFI